MREDIQIGISMVIVLLIIFCIGRAVYYVDAPIAARINHEVRVNSHQYQQSKKTEVIILETAVAQQEEWLRVADDDTAQRITGQLRILKLKLKAARAN